MSTTLRDLIDPTKEKPSNYETQFWRIRELIQQKKEKIDGEIQIRVAQLAINGIKFKTFYDNNDIVWYDVEKGIFQKNGDKRIRQICHSVSDTFSSYHINEIIDKVRRETYCEREEFDPPYLVGVKNGVLKLGSETITFIKHSPDNLLTRAIPVKYDSKATCPKINAFLEEVVSKPNKRILEEAIGYCLLNAYPYHRAFLLFGPTHTGKTTFLSIVRHFLGEENISTVTLQNMSRSDFYHVRLNNKMANISPDLPSQAITTTGVFKALTGEDRITANIKNKEMIDFKNTAKLFFSANEIPASRYDDSDAYYARWIIIDFQTQFLENADPILLSKLTTEDQMSGLLNLAIDSLMRLIARGRFEDTIDLEAKKKAYIMGSDTVKAFVLNKCELSPHVYYTKKGLYKAYCQFCEELGRSPQSLTGLTKGLKNWSKGLVEPDRIAIKGKRTQIYRGVDLK